MISADFLRRLLTVPGALLLSLLVAGQAVAVTWATPKALATGVDAFQGDLATAGGIALAVFGTSDPDEIRVRRSTDSGGSWAPAQLLSSNGILPAIAGRAMNFDVVWNNADTGRVRYARSTNGGASFGPSVGLSPSGRFAWRPAVAHGPSGRVAVIWEDAGNHAIQVRVSTNGGTTFGNTKTLSMLGQDMGVAVAVGDGVIYAAYSVGEESLRLRRSFDDGANWQPAQSITDQAVLPGISLTAAGTLAFVGFSAQPTDPSSFYRARYRSTEDRGAHWSSPHNLASATWTTYDPDLNVQGNVLRAAITRCTPEFDICVDERVFYRQQVGSSWSTAQRVSPSTLFEARVSHVAYAAKILVFYLGDFLPYVRAGTP
jgi:hypothetical protein